MIALDTMKHGDIAVLHVGPKRIVFIAGRVRAILDTVKKELQLSIEYDELMPTEWHLCAMQEAIDDYEHEKHVSQEHLDHCLHVKSTRTIGSELAELSAANGNNKDWLHKKRTSRYRGKQKRDNETQPTHE